MNVTALAATPRLAGHLRVGCSTGFFSEHRGDWPLLVDEATALSLRAIELAALSEDELPGLLAFLGEEPALPCDYVSVHAPSKGRRIPEEELISLLVGLPPWVETVVVHPDKQRHLWGIHLSGAGALSARLNLRREPRAFF